jgi:hypothetical protein
MRVLNLERFCDMFLFSAVYTIVTFCDNNLISGSESPGTSSSHLHAQFPGTNTYLQHRSSNLIIFPPHPHAYAFTLIPLTAVEEMASGIIERQTIPLRPLFSRPLGEPLSPVDKPRQATMPAKLAPYKNSATYNCRIEKRHTNSHKRRGRTSPDLNQQFAGKLNPNDCLHLHLTNSQTASKIPARRFVRRQTKCCPESEVM